MQCGRCQRIMESYEGEMVTIKGSIRNLCRYCSQDYRRLLLDQENHRDNWFYAFQGKWTPSVDREQLMDGIVARLRAWWDRVYSEDTFKGAADEGTEFVVEIRRLIKMWYH